MNIVLMGGDERQTYLSELLAKNGYNTIHIYGANKDLGYDIPSLTKNADVIVLPVPITRDNTTLNAPMHHLPIPLAGVFEMCKGKRILGGSVTPIVATLSTHCGAEITDYLAKEELAVLNAYATAEGASATAIFSTKRTLRESQCLVVGYGRIGKILSRMLRNFGAKVCVTARRNAQLAEISADGNIPTPYSRLHSALPHFNIIFNTAPAILFRQEEISLMRKDAVFIELASLPGGIDQDLAKEAGIRVVSAQGLPGKTAPLSAANYIKDTILNIFQEWDI